jgi:hypothetical protein
MTGRSIQSRAPLNHRVRRQESTSSDSGSFSRWWDVNFHPKRDPGAILAVRVAKKIQRWLN